MKEFYIGLDIHKKSISYCIKTADAICTSSLRIPSLSLPAGGGLGKTGGAGRLLRPLRTLEMMDSD